MKMKLWASLAEQRASQAAKAVTLHRGVLAEFKKRRTRQVIAGTLFLLALVPFGAHRGHRADSFFGYSIPKAVESSVSGVCFFVLLATSIFTLANWRCPKCRRFLGIGWGLGPSSGLCRKCGVTLQAAKSLPPPEEKG